MSAPAGFERALAEPFEERWLDLARVRPEVRRQAARIVLVDSGVRSPDFVWERDPRPSPIRPNS